MTGIFCHVISFRRLFLPIPVYSDASFSEEYEEKLADYIRKSRGVERLDLLRTRMFGNKVYIDAEIAVDGTLSLKDAHAIAEDVHDNVEKKFPNTKHIMIHVNPA